VVSLIANAFMAYELSWLERKQEIKIWSWHGMGQGLALVAALLAPLAPDEEEPLLEVHDPRALPSASSVGEGQRHARQRPSASRSPEKMNTRASACSATPSQ
jgi:hypothetical protein